MRRRTEKRSPRYSGRGSGHDRYPEGPARKLGHQARLAGARRLPLVLLDIQGQDGDFPYGPHRAPEHSRRHGRGGRRGAVPRSSRPGPGAAAAGHYRGQKGGLPSRSGDDAAWGERASHLSRRHQAPLGGDGHPSLALRDPGEAGAPPPEDGEAFPRAPRQSRPRLPHRRDNSEPTAGHGGGAGKRGPAARTAPDHAHRCPGGKEQCEPGAPDRHRRQAHQAPRQKREHSDQDKKGGQMRRLFGKDGVRGVANQDPMTSETALKIGRAAAHVFRDSSHRHKIIIGKDTRLSGYMLESALTSGICSMGVDVLLVGPLPTPGIAFLTRTLRADAGVVIAASHNPFQDNGIKFFSPAGFKLPDELEAEIERLVLSDSIDAMRPTATEIGKAFRIDDAVGRYNVFAKNTFPRHLTLDGMTIAIDCAHGAGYRVGPEVLEELGARVVALGVDPDGENINRDCGALHPAGLQAAVRARGAHLGIALDGDADRAIFVDEHGEVVDGDEVMAILAAELVAQGALRQGTLVATVMSNLGLHLAMRERGI